MTKSAERVYRMSGQNVQFSSNGSQASGYLSRPEGNVPGVVVIQEWWGLNDHIRDIADRFAKAGFVALAPDLYHGKVVKEPNDAQKAAMELDRGRAMKEIDGAVAYLKSQPYVTPKKIGVIGFCMGGGLALHIGARNLDVGAVSAFYGGGSPSADAFASSRAAILNIVGERDTGVTKSIQALDKDLARYKLDHELVVYPDAQHAFFNDTRKEVYNADAAQDAWKRAVDWFRKYLQA
jgi:carboxymethylenebutenolidase